MPWKRFCLFCLFHASLSIVDCSVQLVYTKFPNRVIHRALRFTRKDKDPQNFNSRSKVMVICLNFMLDECANAEYAFFQGLFCFHTHSVYPGTYGGMEPSVTHPF